METLQGKWMLDVLDSAEGGRMSVTALGLAIRSNPMPVIAMIAGLEAKGFVEVKKEKVALVEMWESFVYVTEAGRASLKALAAEVAG